MLACKELNQAQHVTQTGIRIRATRDLGRSPQLWNYHRSSQSEQMKRRDKALIHQSSLSCGCFGRASGSCSQAD